MSTSSVPWRNSKRSDGSSTVDILSIHFTQEQEKRLAKGSAEVWRVGRLVCLLHVTVCVYAICPEGQTKDHWRPCIALVVAGGALVAKRKNATLRRLETSDYKPCGGLVDS